MADDLRARTISGVSWSALSQGVTQVITLTVSIVLARLLGPEAYGLIGMVTVFTGFASLFGGLGLGAAIVQRKELEPRHLDSGFWANAGFGSLMTLLMAGAAPLVAWFYNDPRLTLVTVTISLRFVIEGLSVVPRAVLTRGMRFQVLAMSSICSCVVAGLLGLVLALVGMGVWSLVVQTLGSSVAQLLILWRLGAWRPRWFFEWQACQDLFGFGASILAFDAFNYWSRNFDQLLIGRFVGSSALGIYSRAYTLMLLPLQVSRVVGNVMFPALSSIQDDRPRVKRAYLKATAIISLITFPMMVGLFAVADNFVIALLGTEWAEAIPIIQLYCWVGLIQSIVTTSGLIYTSQGRVRLYFWMGVVGAGANVAAFLVGIHWGIAGVAWAYTIRNIVTMIPFVVVPGRLIGLSLREVVRNLNSTFLCALIMGALVWGVGELLPHKMSHWLLLLIEVVVGICVYYLLVIWVKPKSWQDVRGATGEVLHGLVGRFIPWLKSVRIG